MVFAAIPSAYAREEGAATRLFSCYFKDRQLGVHYHLEFSQVGPGGLLLEGTYLKFWGNGPTWDKESRYRLKPGFESSVSEIQARMAARDLERKNGQNYRNISFKGIDLAAIVVDEETTANFRGKYILLIKGEEMRVGDSFHRRGNGIGKYADYTLVNCH